MYMQESTITVLQGALQRAIGLQSQAERSLLIGQETQSTLQRSLSEALNELRETGKVCASALV